MADATRSQLEQAYRLIQEDDLDQAIAILKPITSAQPDNADAWWLMANAVGEPADAFNALQNVLRLNPNHTQARDLMNQLKAEYPDAAAAAAASDFGDVSSFDDLFASTGEPAATGDSALGSSDLDSLFGSEPAAVSEAEPAASASPEKMSLDDFFGSSGPQEVAADLSDPFGAVEPTFVPGLEEEAAPTKGKKREKPAKAPKPAKVKAAAGPADPLELERRANRRPNTFLVVALVLMLLIVIGAGVLFAYYAGLIGNRGGQPTAVAVATQAGTASSDLASVFQDASTRLTSSNFQSVKANAVQTSAGSELQVEFCGNAGPDLHAAIDQAMDLVAQTAAGARANFQAAGIQVTSCGEPTVVLFRALAPIDAITAYVTGGMKDQATFRASWQHNK